jgi:hypothetical protein
VISRTHCTRPAVIGPDDAAIDGHSVERPAIILATNMKEASHGRNRRRSSCRSVPVRRVAVRPSLKTGRRPFLNQQRGDQLLTW